MIYYTRVKIFTKLFLLKNLNDLKVRIHSIRSGLPSFSPSIAKLCKVFCPSVARTIPQLSNPGYAGVRRAGFICPNQAPASRGLSWANAVQLAPSFAGGWKLFLGTSIVNKQRQDIGKRKCININGVNIYFIEMIIKLKLFIKKLFNSFSLNIKKENISPYLIKFILKNLRNSKINKIFFIKNKYYIFAKYYLQKSNIYYITFLNSQIFKLSTPFALQKKSLLLLGVGGLSLNNPLLISKLNYPNLAIDLERIFNKFYKLTNSLRSVYNFFLQSKFNFFKNYFFFMYLIPFLNIQIDRFLYFWIFLEKLKNNFFIHFLKFIFISRIKCFINFIQLAPSYSPSIAELCKVFCPSVARVRFCPNFVWAVTAPSSAKWGQKKLISSFVTKLSKTSFAQRCPSVARAYQPGVTKRCRVILAELKLPNFVWVNPASYPSIALAPSSLTPAMLGLEELGSFAQIKPRQSRA